MTSELKPNSFHVLLALSEGDQHGYAIMQAVLDRTGGKVRLWPATLYGTLKKLLEEGLIEESGERPAAAFDDARRKYYRLTPSGRAALAAESNRLRELVRILDAAVQP